MPGRGHARRTFASREATDGTAGGWHVILGHPQLLGLIVVTCVFFFLYGPVEVALPIHIAQGLHGSPALLGLFWAVFGVGATFGGLAAGLLRHLPLWVIVVAIIIGWGTALLPLGLSGSVTSGLIGFAAGGMIYGPFTASCTGLFQRTCPPWVLSRVLATRTALTIPSAALGTLVGGPVVVAIGGQRTLLASALLTITFGATVAGMAWFSRARTGTVGGGAWRSGGSRYVLWPGAAGAGQHPQR